MNRQKVEEYFQALEKILIKKDIANKALVIWIMEEMGKSFVHFQFEVLVEY